MGQEAREEMSPHDERVRRYRSLPEWLRGRAVHDPMLRHVTQVYSEGHVTYDELMKAIVDQLAHQRDTYKQRVLTMLENSPTPERLPHGL